MPQIEIPLADYTDAITRSVVSGAIHAVMERTGIPANTRIFYPGTMEQGQQLGSAVTGETDDQVLFSHDNRISIEVDEVPEADTIIAHTGFRPDAPFVFLDPALEVSIRPVFQRQRIEVSFNFRARDQGEAERWRNRQRLLAAQGRGPVLFHPKFHYPINKPVFDWLRTIHELREAKAGYGETFDEYFAKYSSEALTEIVDIAGQNRLCVMPVMQHNVDGYFDWSGQPDKGQREGQGTAWSISFRYSFYYDKPIGLWLTWPLVVHNQLMPERYRYKPEDVPLLGDGDRKGTGYSSVAAMLSHSAGLKNYDPRYYRGYCLPEWDEFITRDIPSNTLRAFTTLIQVDESDPTAVLDLQNVQLPDGSTFGYTPAILRFMIEAERTRMPYPRRSVLNVSVYEGAHRVDPDTVTIDEQLVVRLTRPLDLRKVYHLRLGVYYKWSDLDQDASDSLQNNGDAANDILDAINPEIKPGDIIGDNHLPNQELDRIEDALDDITLPHNRGMWTVQTFTLRTQRGSVDRS